MNSVTATPECCAVPQPIGCGFDRRRVGQHSTVRNAVAQTCMELVTAVHIHCLESSQHILMHAAYGAHSMQEHSSFLIALLTGCSANSGCQQGAH